MGCYGIGPSRLMGLIAEHFADDKGLVWPANVAPATVYLVRIGAEGKVIQAADALYEELTKKGVAVLYDDRDARPGEKFADADLMGIPYRVVVSSKTLAENVYELKSRQSEESELVDHDTLAKMLGIE
jgi:prolyl-tRNA synthetase